MAFVPALPLLSSSATVASRSYPLHCQRSTSRPRAAPRWATASPSARPRTGTRPTTVHDESNSSVARASPSMQVISVGSISEMDTILDNADDSLVIVDYSTSWCGPCKMFAPYFEELSEKNPDVVFVKVLGDASTEANELMVREGIRAVPAFHFWKNKENLKQFTGARKDEFNELLEQLK